MKQVAQNYRSGELAVIDAPAPSCAPGGVLVRTLYSLISTGTEMMKVEESKLSLVGMARARPDQVKKVLETVQQQGALTTYKKAMNRLDSYSPLGYSLAGMVLEVGKGAEEFAVGQLVACAGNEFALHAEINWVPTNLCVAVPDGVSPQLAAFATVGSIALQGVRQGNVQIGDTACVIGLGLVGQLVVQLLVASGVRVVGLDPDPERCRLAEKAGALLCTAPDDDGSKAVEQALFKASGGLGADRIFLVAGGSSNQPVELAARLARDRATVVDIGKCKLDLPWNDYYEKELEAPILPLVRPRPLRPQIRNRRSRLPSWLCAMDRATQSSLLCQRCGQKGNRSRAAHRRDLPALATRRASTNSSVAAYCRVSASSSSTTSRTRLDPQLPVTRQFQAAPMRRHGDASSASALDDSPSVAPTKAAVRIGFVGAGNYASSMLLPHLANQPGIELAHVATRRSLSAVNAQRKFGFGDAGTNPDAVFEDPTIDAVFIVTRHSAHAAMTCRALEAGKAVFVEKPLALTSDELDRILATVDATGNDQNHGRVQPAVRPASRGDAEAISDESTEPTNARYLVNAGQLASDSWYRDSELEGSRFVGEGGHFIDTMSWWIGSDPVEVMTMAGAGADEVQVSLRYGDGSLATVTYLTNVHRKFPKETFEVSSGGRTARLDNFRRATVWSGARARVSRHLGSPDKGQSAQIKAFIDAVRTGGPMPISLESLTATTRATLAATSAVASSTSQPL